LSFARDGTISQTNRLDELDYPVSGLILPQADVAFDVAH
jgi:hypothetical protein